MIKIGIECRCKWYSLRDWTQRRVFRTFNKGFAIGPVMIYKEA